MRTISTALLLALLATCARADDPFAGDQRFNQRVTIKAVAQTMSHMLKDLSAVTGIRFETRPVVEDDKVVLFAHNRPIGESLRTLADFFNFTWRREGEPGKWTYILTQTVDQKKQEDDEMQERIVQAADLIVQESKDIIAALKIPAAERKTKYDELNMRFGEELDPAGRTKLCRQLSALQGASNTGTAAAALVLAGKTRDDIVRMITGGESLFSWPILDGWQTIPARVTNAIWDADRQPQRFGRQGAPHDYTYARVRFSGMVAGPTGIRATVDVGSDWPGNQSGSSTGANLPANLDHHWELETMEPNWGANQLFQTPVNVAFDMARKPPGERIAPDIARALAAVEDQVPFDVISDAHFSSLGGGAPVELRPLGKTLVLFASIVRHRCEFKDGFVRIKSVRYAADRRAEPYQTLLDQWLETPPKGDESLERLAALAAMPLEQGEVLAMTVVRNRVGDYPGAWREHRPWLRLWSTLDPAQKAAAKEPKGLSLISAGAKIKAALIDILTNPQLRRDLDFDQVRKLSVEQLAQGATLKIQVLEEYGWGFRTANRSSVTISGDTRETVFNRIPNRPAGMKLADLRKVLVPRANFEIRSDGAVICRASVSLLPQWE